MKKEYRNIVRKYHFQRIKTESEGIIYMIHEDCIVDLIIESVNLLKSKANKRLIGKNDFEYVFNEIDFEN